VRYFRHTVAVNGNALRAIRAKPKESGLRSAAETTTTDKSAKADAEYEQQ
jgi:hypothetical protein